MSGIVGYQSESSKSGNLGPKPNFKVNVGTNHTLSVGAYDLHIWDTKVFDVGNNFNNTGSSINNATYAFVAPIQGSYSFTWMVHYLELHDQSRILQRFDHYNSAGAQLRVDYVDNSGPDHWANGDMGTGLYAIVGSSSAFMATGDTVTNRTYHIGGGQLTVSTMSTFCGWYTGR